MNWFWVFFVIVLAIYLLWGKKINLPMAIAGAFILFLVMLLIDSSGAFSAIGGYLAGTVISWVLPRLSRR